MINKENYTFEYIDRVSKTKNVDKTILERNIYALGLLEALLEVGMPFIFKGGTSLTILLDKPKRLSTDIDIVVEPDIDINKYIINASKIFPFKNFKEQERKGKNNIIKKHFEFTYDSPAFNREFYIILDVVFEKNHYSRIIEKPIMNDFVFTNSPYKNVNIPSIDCILGDKLTAFAPNTIGIPFNEDKELEIIKQMYDVSCLFDEFENFKDVYETYIETAKAEISYRGNIYSIEDALNDTIETSASIISRGLYGNNYDLLLKGIRGLSNHIIDESFTGENAVSRACKSMYIASCILANIPMERIIEANKYSDANISKSKYSKLGKIRNVEPIGFAYVAKAIKQINK